MSNVYTGRILSEHPVANWPMEDGASFVSLITESQRDMTSGWSDTNCDVTAGPNIERPFSELDVYDVSHSGTGLTAAGEVMTIELGSLFTSDDIYSGISIAAAAYVYIETAASTASIDIGSSGTNYTRNYIDPTTSDSWVKIESSELEASDGSVYFRFNLNESVDRSNAIFYINGLTVGQYLEPYSSSALGVQGSKIGPYIKGIGIDIAATVADYSQLCININKSDANAITLPIKVDVATATSDSVTLDQEDDSYLLAKRIYENFKGYKKIILEPYPWINSGANDPDEMDPATPADWFESWQAAVVTIAQEMPDAWGVYAGTGFELIEDEASEWIELFDAVRLAFRGHVMYKTKWWITDTATPSTYTDYETNKLDAGLWAGVDIISISAFFELTTTDDPSQAQIETALRSTDVSSRAQDVYQEVINFWDTWETPILLGDLTCPALDDGAYHPWDESVSGVSNTDIQADLIAAYQTVFGDADGYVGFSVPYSGVGNDYELESSASSYLSGLSTAPINNAFVELAPAISVGVGDYDAYYCIEEKRLAAYTTGIPMVYGTDKYVRLRSVGEYQEQPSFVFDGQGAFNDSGSNQTYTIEFWMRIHGYTKSDRKIFGPLETKDGLYLNGSTLSIVYGDNFVSANVGVFYYPSLITIRLHNNKIDLSINGEIVASTVADRGSYPLANSSNKFLGFFSYPDIEPIDISSVTVFGYVQPTVLAKRHFAWGQAVDSVDTVNARFDGTTVQPEFSAVKSVNNVSYPNTFNWNAGSSSNLEVVQDKLTTVNRPLPEIALSDKTEDDFYADGKLVQSTSDPFFTFRPDNSWSSESAHFVFENFDDYSDLTRAFGFVWSADTVSGEETLAVIRSKQDPLKHVRFYRDGANVKVQFVNNDTITELESTAISVDNKYFSVVDFTKNSYASFAPIDMRTMIKSISDLEVLLGGNGESTFTGKIYSASFYDPYTYSALADELVGYITETIDYEAATSNEQDALDKASYQLVPRYKYGSYFADVEQVGYWEDYIPLTMMSRFVSDYAGQLRTAADHIQFDIGAPRPSLADVYPPTYAMLTELYTLTGYSYEDFEDEMGPDLYEDFYLPYHTFLTDGLEIKAFVSFQDQSDELKSLAELGEEFAPRLSNTIYYDEIGAEFGDKLEVIDGTTIIVPSEKRIDDTVLSVHLEFYAKDSIARRLQVKSMDFATYAGNRNQFTDIGSKTGIPIYPFTKTPFYYDHSAVNPFRVGKRNHGPLYLGRESGYTPSGSRTGALDRGLLSTVTQAATNTIFELGGLQFWIAVDVEFPRPGEVVFEFEDGDTKIQFVIDSLIDSEEYAKLSVLDENGDPYIAANFFQNGSQVLSLYLHKSEWTSIAVYFDSPLLMESLSPKIKMYPGSSYLNVSYFEPDESLVESLLARQWIEIDDEYWEYWTYGSSFESGESSWFGALFPGDVVVSESALPSTLFNSYTGRNTVSVTPQSSLDMSQGKILVYTDVLAATYSQQPS